MKPVFIQARQMTKNGRGYVTPHISVDEVQCPKTKAVKLFMPLAELFEAVRVNIDKPIKITSGYRCQEYQDELRKRGYKAALHSPHTEGAALDLALPTGYTCGMLIDEFLRAACELGLPEPRFGYKAYNDRFLHVDLVFMLFAPYTDEVNPQSTNWAEGVEW